jgi:hypothetical protein
MKASNGKLRLVCILVLLGIFSLMLVAVQALPDGATCRGQACLLETGQRVSPASNTAVESDVGQAIASEDWCKGSVGWTGSLCMPTPVPPPCSECGPWIPLP